MPDWSQMDSEKLKALQIRHEAKRRPQRSLWIIFLGVALLTGVGAFYALPKKDDERRLAGEEKLRPPSDAAAAAPSSAPIAPSYGAVLTVSGYIVNRERIE